VWRVVAAAVLALGVSGTVASAEDKVWPLDVTLGKADAPNTVIEYFSLNCPHCARFEADPFPKLKAEFVDTGKVKWVMRDYPLNDVALAAAMIAHCSGDRYMAFVDAFFQTQQAWAGAKDPLGAIKITARIGGMDGPAVDKCLADNTMLTAINARATEGTEKLGVKATPTFFVNGDKVEGERSYDEFAKLLHAAK
jgi:protein-disulfide isomerase